MEELSDDLEWMSSFAVEFRCSGIVAIFDYHAAHCIFIA